MGLHSIRRVRSFLLVVARYPISCLVTFRSRQNIGSLDWTPPMLSSKVGCILAQGVLLVHENMDSRDGVRLVRNKTGSTWAQVVIRSLQNRHISENS